MGRAFDELTRGGQVRRLASLAGRAAAAWGLDIATMEPIHHFHNTVFRIRTVDGRRWVMRVSRPGYQTEAALRSEATFLADLAARGAPVPAPVPDRHGGFIVTADAPGVPEPRRCMLLPWIDGRLERARVSARRAETMGRLAATYHRFARSFAPPDGFERPTLDVDGVTGAAIGFPRDLVRSRLGVQELRIIDDAAILYGEALASVPGGTSAYGLLHADIHASNVVHGPERSWLIDFDDLAWGPWAYDLAAVRWGFTRSADREELFEQVLTGYACVEPVPEGDIDGLLAGRRVLIALWLAGNLGHPSFPDARGWIDEEIAALRVLLART